MSFKFKQHNCRNCGYNLSKKLLKDISFNWKTITCPKCKEEYQIKFPNEFYSSFAWGIPVGVIATSPIYLSIEPSIKFGIIIINLITIILIFMFVLVKKSHLE